MLSINDSIKAVNRKQQKVLASIFKTPTPASIKFSDIEKLLIAPGAEKLEGSGSRVAFVMPNNRKWLTHRPHPGSEAKKYQVNEAREFLESVGVKNE